MEDPRIDALLEELRHLRARMAELEVLVAAGHARPVTSPAAVREGRPDSPGSEPALEPVEPVGTPPALPARRDLLRLAGTAAAAGAMAGAAAAVGSSSPAAAANGDPILAGQTTTATSETRLAYTGSASAPYLSVVGPGTGAVSGNVVLTAVSAGDNTTALRARHTGLGIAVSASSQSYYGISVSGGRADLWLSPTGTPPPTRSDYHSRGELHPDSTGELWYCVAGGTPGSWRKVSGPATAGALHLLPTTTRVYDSRAGQEPLGGIKGKFISGAQRVIDTTNNGSGVPTGATAVLVNLTATNTNSGGFFAAFANGVAWPGNSSVNWSFLNSTVANLAVVAVDALALFKLRCESGGQPGADAVVDVIGYYR